MMMSTTNSKETKKVRRVRPKIRKHMNLPLVAGGVILAVIIIVMLFPSLFTNINPYSGDGLKNAKLQGGEFRITGAPFPPSKDFLLGSDLVGRDIFSLIIYGTRLTITLGFLVVVGRFLVSIPLGIAAGFGNRLCKGIINQTSILFSAIPALVISFIILNMKFFTSLYKTESILAFVIVLTIIGFGKLGQVIDERVTGILAKDFINGEKAIGKSKFKIAFQNVLPHLAPELIVLFFMEFAYALAIIMQLGIFKVFVGNLRIVEDYGPGGIVPAPVSFEPEWASMLGAANTNIMSSPWTLIFPALAFFISILGLNLFGEGLRKILQRRDSNFIPKIRRVLSIEKDDLKISNLNPIKGKFRFATIIMIVVVLCIGATKMGDTKYVINSQEFNYTQNQDEVIVGTEEAGSVAKYIASEFKKEGLTPVGEDFIIPYKNGSQYYCYDSRFNIKASTVGNSIGEGLKLELGRDYAPGSFYDFKVKGQIYDSTAVDLFSIKDYKQFDNRIILLDGGIYSTQAMTQIADKIMKNSKALGILAELESGEELPKLFGTKGISYPFLWVTNKTAITLAAATSGTGSNDKIVDVTVKCRKLLGTGYNVMGMIKGKSEQKNDKIIMLGFSYNYTSEQKQEGIAKMKLYLELVKRLSEKRSDRSIMVAFWDGTDSDNGNGAYYCSKNAFFETEKIDAYIDMTKLDAINSNHIQFSSELAPISRYFAWSLAHKIKSGLESSTTVINYEKIRKASEIIESVPNEDEAMYIYGKMPIILIANSKNMQNESSNNISLDKIGSVVFKTIENIVY